MATSEWLKELRQTAIQGTTTPTETISKQRDTTGAPTAPTQAMNDAAGGSLGTAQNAPQRLQRAFTAPTDGTRDYRKMYAALFNFHERHSPPTLGDDDGDMYWTTATDEIVELAEQFGDDPFMNELLVAVFHELESEYKTMRQQCAGATG